MAFSKIRSAMTVLALLIALGQAACQRADLNQKIEQGVLRLEQELNAAMIRGNLTTLDRILAADLVLITPAGHVVTKADEMAAFGAGETRFEAFAAADTRVQLYGPNALVTGLVSIRGHLRGQEMTGQYRYSRLYARPEGDLQLVASQWTPVEAVPLVSDRKGAEEIEIITVRPGDISETRQGHRQFVGISRDSAGAQGISMNLVVIPPGGQAAPHWHRGYETAIYVLQGQAETCYGPGLARSVINEAGDFVYIPPDVPHQPRNLSDTDPVLAIVARNDPDEQESIVPYEPMPND